MRCKQYDDGSDAHLAQGYADEVRIAHSKKAAAPATASLFMSFRGRQSRTQNLEILWCGSPHHSSMLRIAPE